ncbi:MAG: SPOR domain-containing protein [Porticoccaceae bacterium]|jgi:septal ring-binding cell division protein DamX
MGIRVLALLLVFAAATGCSAVQWNKQEKGEVTLSWYCIKKPGSNDQYCEKRRLRNGKPVDAVVYETMMIPDGKAPPPVMVPTAAQAPKTPSAGEAIPWSRQSLTAVNPIDDHGAQLAVENLGPVPRKPKNTVDLWEKRGSDKTAPKVVMPKSEAGASNKARPKRAEPGKAAPAESAVTPLQQSPEAKLQGYTVQLAAFATLKQCQTFMANRKYQHLALIKKKILSNGEPWWIVTHGQFASYAEAQRMSKQLSAQYAGLNTWARSWAVITKQESR